MSRNCSGRVKTGRFRLLVAAGFLLALSVMLAGCGWGARLGRQTGRLTGKVTDARNGAPLPAIVTVNGVVYKTVDGVYVTNPLPLGSYLIKVESPGYYPQTQTVSLSSATRVQSFDLAVIPDSTIPVVLSTTPASGATGVYLDSALVLRFSEPMDRASVEAALRAEPAVSFKFTWSGNNLIAAPDPAWSANRPYQVTLGTGARDVTGNQLAAPVTVTFVTGSTTIPRAAFASNGDDPYGRLKIYLLNPESPGAPVLLSTGDYVDEQPAWSPDGTRLVFVSWRGTASPHLYVTRVNAFDPRPLLPISAFKDVEPKWSPDGRRIAFTSDRVALNHNIFVVEVDPVTGQAIPGTEKQVTLDPNWDANAEWSPDRDGFRNLLAFSSDRGSGARLIYAVDVEDWGGAIGEVGGRTVSLLTPGDTGADDPAWSPDGTKIAYTSDRDGTKDIWLMDVTVTAGPTGRVVTASNRRRLTTDPDSNWAVDEQPAWSPDGKRLLFVSDRSGSPDIYQLDLDNPGAAPVLMVSGQGTQTNPAWARR
ncbi:MAG: Ig-like domain-containing protein [Betaproteobacteria bacterium]